MSWITGWLILIAVFHFYLKLCLNQSSQRMSTVSFKKNKIAVDLSNQDFNEENKKSQLKYFFEKLRFHPNSFPSIPNLVPCVSSTFHICSQAQGRPRCVDARILLDNPEWGFLSSTVLFQKWSTWQFYVFASWYLDRIITLFINPSLGQR